MSSVKLRRCCMQPILERRPGCAWETHGVWNPGVVRGPDGKIHMLYRAGYMSRNADGSPSLISQIGHAASSDGIHFEREPEPVLGLDGEDPAIFNVCGVEDPRISRIENVFYIVYSLRSSCWDRLALASTRDFRTYVKHGLVTDDIAQRTGALFPEKIGGKYYLLHRPLPNMWISESCDLKNWQNARMILTREILSWTEVKLGVCAPPIRTERAWAVIFHGKDRYNTYRLGIMWLDLENPAKVLYVQPEPILEPEAEFELHNGGNRVYSCGAVECETDVKVYYGAGGGSIGVASMPRDLLELPREV